MKQSIKSIEERLCRAPSLPITIGLSGSAHQRRKTRRALLQRGWVLKRGQFLKSSRNQDR